MLSNAMAQMNLVRKTEKQISTYFEVGEEGIELIEDELLEMTFGEFLVENSALTRAQLFDALREQDKHPGIPLGEVVCWLGYLSYADVDKLLTRWNGIPVVEVDSQGRPVGAVGSGPVALDAKRPSSGSPRR